MIRFPIALMLLVLPAALIAQDKPADDASKPLKRIRNVQLSQGERCPPAADDEIVVCGTLDEPYRIPKQFRESKPDAANQSWVNRAATIDEVGRVAGGLPNTCSPVGTGGQTGCVTKMLREYTAEKVEKKRLESSVP
ncbi:hypothetical protein [Sphingomonas sp.]|uniref:hypothetical protein n=1 Tax=Sphingomonas sp. TaxID=28214 RepID=UPI003D6D7927